MIIRMMMMVTGMILRMMITVNDIYDNKDDDKGDLYDSKGYPANSHQSYSHQVGI